MLHNFRTFLVKSDTNDSTMDEQPTQDKSEGKECSKGVSTPMTDQDDSPYKDIST